MRRFVLTSIAALLAAFPAAAAWQPDGVDLTRPRVLLRPGDVAAIQARLDREPYVALMREAVRRIRQADGVGLDDHTIGSERLKARAAKNLAFLYAIDRTVAGDAVVPFSTDDRAAAAARVAALLRNMFTRSRLAVGPPLGGFDRDINTSEELQQYATAYDTLRGAGFDFGADDAAIVANLTALASELYDNYVNDSAGGFANVHQNNHRSKVGAALAVTGLVLAEQTPPSGSDPLGIREPAAWIEYGLDQVDLMMRFALLTGDGAYSEGPFYLRYASQNLLPFWRAWDRLLNGADYTVGGVAIPSFWRHPLLDRTLQWALDTTVPDGSQAPTDDGNVGRSFYFGAAPLTPAFAWRWANTPDPYDTDGSISLAADAIALYDDTVVPAPPSGSPSAFYVEGGTAVFRSDWSPDAVLAIVQAEHDVASEFSRGRDGLGIGPQSHEHAEPGSFLLHAFGERLAIDPGYFTFGERNLVSKPQDHNMILVDGAGPVDYFLGSLAWLQDPLGRPPVDGHATLADAIDGDGLDAARVVTSYGSVAIERRVVFADDRYLFIADRAGGSGAPRAYTWLLHGNGGGDSGGTFERTAAGGRWSRPAATLEMAIGFDVGAPTFTTADSPHEDVERARRTHTTLRATATGSSVHSAQLVYPIPAGHPVPETADLERPGVAGVLLNDAAGNRQVLAMRAAPGIALDVAEHEASPTLAAVSTDGDAVLIDADASGNPRLLWADNVSVLSYGDRQLRARTRGRLGLRLTADGEASLIHDTADPLVTLDAVPFAARTADGACRLLDDGTLILGRERRVTLSAEVRNARPAADPGPDLTVTPPTGVVLNGSASCDADGDSLTPRWELVSAPAGSSWSLAFADQWLPSLIIDRVGVYRVRLVVEDAHGLASLPRELVVVSGLPCGDGVDNDLDGLFDTDDADCDASANRAPSAASDTARLFINTGEHVDLTVEELFTDLDGDPLFLQAASTEPAVSTAASDGRAVIVTGVRPGRARLHVTADDGRGGRAHRVLRVDVADACDGDCDGDGLVTIHEVVAALNVALGTESTAHCAAADVDRDGRVDVAELIVAVGRVLAGCPTGA